MKRSLFSTTALLVAFAAAPALAAPADSAGMLNGFYASLGFGASLTNDVDVDFKSANVKFSSAIDNGFAIAGALGYRVYPWLRVEGEIGHFGGDFDGSDTGSLGVMTYMANGYIDLPNKTAFTPYATLGLGAASISAKDSESFSYAGSNYTWTADDSDIAFAWQAGLGVSYQVFKHLSADLSWRYLSTSDVKLNTNLSGVNLPFETSVSSNIIRLGVRYEF